MVFSEPRVLRLTHCCAGTADVLALWTQGEQGPQVTGCRHKGLYRCSAGNMRTAVGGLTCLCFACSCTRPEAVYSPDRFITPAAVPLVLRKAGGGLCHPLTPALLLATTSTCCCMCTAAFLKEVGIGCFQHNIIIVPVAGLQQGEGLPLRSVRLLCCAQSWCTGGTCHNPGCIGEGAECHHSTAPAFLDPESLGQHCQLPCMSRRL